jgi:mRNA deadenylase 3'-5' endonuclease subunit Ccr4
MMPLGGHWIGPTHSAGLRFSCVLRPWQVPGNESVLDYIWVSRDTVTVEAVLEPLAAKDRAMATLFSLPNANRPSDHLPIGAVLRQN